MVNRRYLVTFADEMKMRVKNMTLKTVALLMVTIIAMLTFNQSVNLHTHQLSDGTVITHAHPYNKTNDTAPIKNHHHTIKAFLILNHTSLLFLSIFVVLSLVLFTAHRLKHYIKAQIYQDHYLSLTLGRAPPVFS